MITFRFISMALVPSVAGTLIACNTAPPMRIAMATAPRTAPPDHLAHMDTQTKAMQAIHKKMMDAKLPEERNSLMTEHMNSMQDDMKMVEGMASPGMDGMKSMADMPGDMGAHQIMMKMMMDRMPAVPA